METVRRITVPTGDILVVKGEFGLLEMLSIADYGKEVNLKCDALGLTRDIEKVEHTKLLPLTEKWVITISTQYGCNSDCLFCDVPKVGKGVNASFSDLVHQVAQGIKLHPDIESCKHLNIHYARMGEPSWNMNVLESAKWIHTYMHGNGFNIHPVVSTMMPRKNANLAKFIKNWMIIKNDIYGGNAGLQLSINSTNEDERAKMFSGNASTLEEIANIMDGIVPKGRKITLNFAVAGYEINPEVLLRYFNPENYICKLTPMHKTDAALGNNIKTDGDYTTFHPYKEYEDSLKKAGYDVLVFIASKEEDEGLITCGNAILSGKMPTCEYKEEKY